jgi:dienelactone hydrolase
VSEPWVERFRAPRTLWVQIARSRPERGLAATNRTGAFQIERWDVPTGALDAVTNDASGKYWGALSPNGEWIVWHADQAGNESGHFVAARWNDVTPIDLTPDLPVYSSFTSRFSGDGCFVAAIIAEGLNGLLVIPWTDAGPGPPRLLDIGKGFVQEIVPGDQTADGRRVIAYATIGDGLASILHVVSADDGQLLLEVDHRPGSVVPVEYLDHQQGSLLASTSSSGTIRPIVIESSGAVRAFELSDVRGDLKPIGAAPDGSAALVLGVERSVERLYVLGMASGELELVPNLSGVFEPFAAGVGTFYAPDGNIVVTREDGSTPPEVVVLSPTTGAVERVLIPAPEVPKSRGWRSLEIPTQDGATVQGWLVTPVGPGPFPTIVHVHGGPESNAADSFLPVGQAWVDHGFAFFTLNYRGSTGFGRDYQQAISGRPGHFELIDLVAAHEYLVDGGIAMRDSVVVSGASYGGYLTLLALGRRPDLWAAGVALVAIADWRMMYDEGIDLREYQAALFGGTPSERPAVYAEASPVTYVGQLAAPLLIIQGRNDARCPASQMQRYVDLARDLGKSVEIDWFDAGHATVAVETEIDFVRRSIAFVQGALASRSSNGAQASHGSLNL